MKSLTFANKESMVKFSAAENKEEVHIFINGGTLPIFKINSCELKNDIWRCMVIFLGCNPFGIEPKTISAVCKEICRMAGYTNLLKEITKL